MPFTLAHPAAILPLRSIKLPFSALVIGSMSSDLFYLGFIKNETSHTITGIFSFCVPMGLAFYFLFHYLLKYPLLDLFPEKHSAFLNHFAKPPAIGSLRNFAMLLLALTIGAFTHLAWDSVTHHDGWFVRHVICMQQYLYKGNMMQLEVCRLLQHISSFAGMLILFFFYRKAFATMKDRQAVDHLFNPWTRFTIALSVCFAGIITSATIYLTTFIQVFDAITLHEAFYNFINGTIKTIFFLTILYAILWYILKYHRATAKNDVPDAPDFTGVEELEDAFPMSSELADDDIAG
jgi:hypothetical protein